VSVRSNSLKKGWEKERNSGGGDCKREKSSAKRRKELPISAKGGDWVLQALWNESVKGGEGQLISEGRVCEKGIHF